MQKIIRTINTKLKWENCFGRLTLGHAFFSGLLVAFVIKPFYWSHLSFDIAVLAAKPSCEKSSLAFFFIVYVLLSGTGAVA